MKNNKILYILTIILSLFMIGNVSALQALETCTYKNDKLSVEFVIYEDGSTTEAHIKGKLNTKVLGDYKEKDEYIEIRGWDKRKTCPKYASAYDEKDLGGLELYVSDSASTKNEWEKSERHNVVTLKEKKVQKVCKYSEEGILENSTTGTDIYEVRYFTDGTAKIYYTDTFATDEIKILEIKNWAKNNSHIQNNQCFEFLYHDSNYKGWVLHDSGSSADKGTSVKRLIRTDTEKNELNKIAKQCSYRNDKSEQSTITLEYNKYGSVISVFGTQALLSNEVYDANNRYANNKDCEDPIYICGISGGAIGKVYYYPIHDTNEKNEKDCFKYILAKEEPKNYKPTLETTSDVISSGETVGVALSQKYEKLSGEMKSAYDDYNECINGDKVKCIEHLREYNSKKEELINWCHMVTESRDYNDSDLKSCLNALDEDIKDYEIDATGEDCYLSAGLRSFLGNIIRFIRFFIPSLIIILGIFDLLRAIAKEDGMARARKNLINRLIAAVLIFVAPSIIIFFLEQFGFIAKECEVLFTIFIIR